MATFQFFLQSREQVVDRRGQIRRIGVGEQDIGLQVPGEPGR